MKGTMKAKLILKSLADLPGNALELAASVPGRALIATRHALAPPARATRRQIRAARQHSRAFVQELLARANSPMRRFQSWTPGGINE